MTDHTKIGVAQIEYNEDGTVKTATFKPTMKLEVKGEALKSLLRLTLKQDNSKDKLSRNEDILKYNAEVALSTWFNKMNEIELADREEYYIVSEIKACTKYPSGVIQNCRIEFHFMKRLESSAVTQLG